MAINKVVYDGKTLIDLTGDTVTKDVLLSGYTAHAMSGIGIEGSCTFDSDTSDSTVTASEILSGKTGYARGTKLTGTMHNNGAIDLTIETKDQNVTIPQGFHDGSGTVIISETERDKIVENNIKEGVVILGVTGTLKPSSQVTAQAKTATPSTETQTIIPDDGTDYLSQVTIQPIPYVESANSAGGTTVTIAG